MSGSTAAVGSGLTLLGDHPHVDGGDPLEFDRIAENLTALVLSSRGSTPFTLGIEAGWGRGKSTLMRKLEQSLDREPAVTTVWFNAWTSDRGTALEGLIKAVLDRLDPGVLRRAARRQQLLGWARAVSTAVAELLRLGTVANAIWSQISTDPKARNDMRELMVHAMEEWTGARRSAEPQRLLVVFVDDLDRCSPDSVLQIFEAIKLYLDAPGFVFVVGYDRTVVSDAILDAKQYSESTTSHNYLEKIIQIVYRIPDPGDAEVNALMDLYLDRSETGALFDSSARALVIEQNTRNPRRVKRFINGFVLEYGLDSEWRDLGPETLVRVLILDLYFPDFAVLLRSRSTRDPVEDFTGYVQAREVLRRGVPRDGSDAWQGIDAMFADRGLAAPAPGTSPDAALQTIEQELPEAFPRLARNSDFLSLLAGLGDAAERARLREKLRRYSPTLLRPASPETPTRILISYRREDTAAHAGRLRDALTARFPEEAVYMDVRVEAGVSFVEGILNAAESAGVMLVVIGRNFLAVDADGRPRLENPSDFVRLEIGAGLTFPDTRVIPVLVGGATMPGIDRLPGDLAGLTRLQAIELTDDRWAYDVERLVNVIEYALTPRPTADAMSSNTA